MRGRVRSAAGALAALAALVLLAPLVAACGKGGEDEAPSRRADTARVARAAATADSGAADSTPVVGRSRLAGPDFIDVDYRLVGTEPSWSLEMTRDGMVFRRVEGEAVTFPFGQMRRRPRFDAMRSSSGGREISAEVRREPCRDGKGDRVYPFAARVEIDGEVLTGCAFEPPVEAAPVPETAIGRAGLTELVRDARRTRAGKAALRRVTGSLADPATAGASIGFAAYSAGDTLRLIEARTTVAPPAGAGAPASEARTVSEVSYFFDPPASSTRGSPRLRLVDADTWNAAGVHAWAALGFDASGAPTGELYEVDGVAAAVPAEFVREQRAAAARLVAAARQKLDGR